MSAAAMANGLGLVSAFGLSDVSLVDSAIPPFIRARSGTSIVPVAQGQLVNFSWIMIPDVNRRP